VEMDSTNFAYVDYLASSYGDMGNVLKESNKLNDAILKYQKALNLREGLVNKDPENRFWQRSLLALQKKLDDTRVEYFLERARALKAEAKLAEAIEQYRKALADSERLVQKDSKNTAWQERLQEVRKELEAALTE
jgi:tetratricopeptide (TPR) repeat protein